MGEMQDEEERECVEKEEWRCSSRTFYVPVYRRLLPTSWMGLNKAKQRVLLGNLCLQWLYSIQYVTWWLWRLNPVWLTGSSVTRGSTWETWLCLPGTIRLQACVCLSPQCISHQRGKFWPLILLSQSKMVSKLKDSWPWICDSKLHLWGSLLTGLGCHEEINGGTVAIVV